MDTTISRRDLVVGAAAAGAVAAGAATARAAETAASSTTDAGKAGAGTADANAAAAAQQGVLAGEEPWDARPMSVADKVTAHESYDCVVVGAGNVGVVTSLHLAQLGAKVLLVEQSDACCMWAGDIDALDSQIQKDLGIQIDKEYVVEDLLRYNQGKCDQNLIRQWAYNAGALVDWYQEQMQAKGLDVMVDTRCKRFYPEGVYYSPASVHTAFKPPLKETANSMGSEIANPAMLELYAEAGGEVLYNTKAVELVQPDGPGTRVTGVICQLQDGSFVQYDTAKAVFLCTGGFSGNKDMMDQLGVQTHKFCSNHMGGDGRNGDGIKMAHWAGADMDHEMAGSCNIFDRGCITGDETNGGIGWDGQGGGNNAFWWPGSQPFLRVNQFGKRFCNEDGPYDVVFNLGAQQPGGFYWQVFDDSSWDDVVSFDTTICSRVVAKPGAKNCLLLGQFYPCTSEEQWREVYLDPNVESGNLLKCDTLEELAEAMGMDADASEAFLQTVEHYNELVAQGCDTDYGKAPWRLTAIDQPPYYACKLAGWLLSTLGGIRVDTTYTPLTPAGERIEGLKVCGLDHGGFFNGMYAQYYGGLNLSHNLISGWLAAKSVMGEPYPHPLYGPDHAYKVNREDVEA